MAEGKPCISELYESGGLDMDLVGKIDHNELDKRKTLLPDSEHALASEYIDFYIDVNYSEIIERYTEVLDTELSAEDFRNGEISPEFVLGRAIARGAESHASADIEYFSDEFSSRAVIEIEELCLLSLRCMRHNADDFSLAGVNPDRKFPIGFVSVRDVVDAVVEFGSEHMKPRALRKPSSASSGMSSLTASRSMRSSRWKKSTTSRVSRASTISAIRKAKRPALSRIARRSNTVRQAMSRASSQGD